MRRLSLWMKAHPMVGDSAVAALLALFDLLLFVAREATGDPIVGHQPWFVSLPVIVATVLPLAFRRRRPVWVAYLVLLIGIPHSLLELGIASLITTCVALYTLVTYVGRRQALLYLGANAVAGGVQIPIQFRDEWAPMVITGALSFAFCWVLGEFVGARRAYHAEVEARLHLLETERDQQARIAVAEERARIARELHDVVAHAVSVIVVQADGAAYAVRSQPDLAERAVETISATGREALTELRRLLGVLRSEQGAVERTPQPGTQSLSELAERVRAVGLPVRLDIAGDIDDLPAGVGLGIYRIVQEALTNSLKHAGAGASAVVTVTRAADRVELNISDDGASGIRAFVRASGSPPIGSSLALRQRAYKDTVGVSGGNGLIGMRERAHVFGGALDAGPRPGGGWQVSATLPLGGA